jgi:hypothetical protein
MSFKGNTQMMISKAIAKLYVILIAICIVVVPIFVSLARVRFSQKQFITCMLNSCH